MKKDFFNRFEPQEKAAYKSVSMATSDWDLIEAYRLYGASRAGHEIPFQKLIRELLIGHINADKEFFRNKNDWLQRSAEIKDTQGE